MADGSEIRSLAGRAARLGDGTSRNPSNRDELLEQRSKDLRGLIGQVRGFNLDEFLSDYEEPGAAIPWALGNDGWVASESDPQPSVPRSVSGPVTGATLAASFAAAGVKPRLKVLYAADYIPASSRVERTAALVRELSLCMPNYEIQLGLAEGPFEDDLGVASHFGKEAFLAKQVTKFI